MSYRDIALTRVIIGLIVGSANWLIIITIILLRLLNDRINNILLLLRLLRLSTRRVITYTYTLLLALTRIIIRDIVGPTHWALTVTL